MDSVSLGNSSLTDHCHTMGQETPSPIDTSTLEDVSLHDEDIGDDENTNKSSDPHSGNTGAGTTPTSKVSALARKLFKKSESTKFLCENLKNFDYLRFIIE